MHDLRKGSELDLVVEKLTHGGKAMARVDDFVVFLEHGIPGQSVRARLTRKKAQFAEARVIEVYSQPSHYVEPFCPHFGTCGGCQWQDLSYSQQLHWKRVAVMDCLVHLAGMEAVEVEETLPSAHEKYYRNKMEFTFSNRRWLSSQEIGSRQEYARTFCLGLHARGAYDRVFNLETCFLQSPQSVEILWEVRRLAEAGGLAAYSTKDHQGFWRFLVIREGKKTDETLVHLITAAHPNGERVVDTLARRVHEKFPSVTTFVHSISQKKAQVALGDASRVLFGPGFIEERLGNLRFQISAQSFFQTNSYGAEALCETIGRFGGFTGRETVWDLYCGTGAIALYVAPRVRRVVGIELVAEAIQDAYRNSNLNGIDNCSFRVGDLKDVIKEMAEGSGRSELPDVVITDPPRAGMHPTVIKALQEIKPKRIIAVSCNPATLARDLGLLSEDYEVQAVQPIDLFPHTAHVECVVNLEKKS